MLDNLKVEILLLLLNQNSYITINTISESFNISNRTVRYYLDDIDYWLKTNGYTPITRVPRKGVILDITGKEKKSIEEQLLSKEQNNPSYILSPKERQKIITFYLLKSEKPINLKDLADITFVSEATISNDLNRVESWLEKYKIVLVRKKGVGISVEGSEKDIRRGIAANLKSMATREKDYSAYNITNQIAVVKKWFPELDLDFIRDQIDIAEDYLGIKFRDDEFINLLTHITLAIERMKLNKDIVMEESALTKLKSKDEFKVAQLISKKISDYFNISIPEDEVGYVTLHLVGAKIGRVKNKKDYLEKDKKLLNLIEEMIFNVEKNLNVKFKDSYELKRDLYIHLKPAIVRLKYEKILENPLLDQIKSKYREIFNACTGAVKILEREYNIQINEHEISYISMHFSASMELKNINHPTSVKVLLICASGIGTSKLLHSQLVSYFTSFEVVDTLSYQEAMEYDHYEKVDLVITTIPLDFQKKPTVTVTPILDTKDIELLSKYLHYTGKNMVSLNNSLLIMEVLTIISRHCRIDNMEGLQMELISLFNDINRLNNINESYEVSKNILSKDHIQIKVKCKDWEDAIRKAAIPLLEQGYIKKEYTDNIIEKINKYGPYMVIAPGIALPHAGIHDGVHKTGISIMTLEEPINFNHSINDPVHTVILLAAKDNYSHIDFLNQIIDVLAIEENIETLKRSTNPEEILELIK